MTVPWCHCPLQSLVNLPLINVGLLHAEKSKKAFSLVKLY